MMTDRTIHFVVLVLALVSLLCAATSAEAQTQCGRSQSVSQKDIKSLLSNHVFQVEIGRGDGSRQFNGTATVIDNRGYLITAAHVIEDYQNLPIIIYSNADPETGNRGQFLVDVHAIGQLDESGSPIDIAILKVADRKLDQTEQRTSAELWRLGGPGGFINIALGELAIYDSGMILGFQNGKSTADFIEFSKDSELTASTRILAGHSGSLVVGDDGYGYAIVRNGTLLRNKYGEKAEYLETIAVELFEEGLDFEVHYLEKISGVLQKVSSNERVAFFVDNLESGGLSDENLRLMRQLFSDNLSIFDWLKAFESLFHSEFGIDGTNNSSINDRMKDRYKLAVIHSAMEHCILGPILDLPFTTNVSIRSESSLDGFIAESIDKSAIEEAINYYSSTPEYENSEMTGSFLRTLRRANALKAPDSFTPYFVAQGEIRIRNKWAEAALQAVRADLAAAQVSDDPERRDLLLRLARDNAERAVQFFPNADSLESAGDVAAESGDTLLASLLYVRADKAYADALDGDIWGEAAEAAAQVLLGRKEIGDKWKAVGGPEILTVDTIEEFHNIAVLYEPDPDDKRVTAPFSEGFTAAIGNIPIYVASSESAVWAFPIDPTSSDRNNLEIEE